MGDIMLKAIFKLYICLANSALLICALTNNVNVLRGIHLKAYAFEYPPLIAAVKDSNGTITAWKGFCADFIYTFAEHFGISLEFVQENATEVAEKGQFIAAFQTIARKEVDFAYLAIAQSLDLWRIMDFTSVSLQEMFVLLIPWPEEESRLTAVIRPFNLITWSMIFVSTLAFVGLLAFLPFINRYRRINGVSVTTQPTYSFLNILGKGTMYVLAIFTQHGGNLRQIGITSRFSLRLMLCLWLLMTVVIINLYTSTLTSFLTVVKLKPIPNSVEELVSFHEHDQKECLATMQKGNPALKKFYNATYTPYRKIGDWLVQNPKYLTNIYEEISNNIVQHRCAHMGVPSSSSYRIGTDYKRNGKCRMTISKPLEFSYIFTVQLQKDSPYTSIVNDFVLRVNSAGLMEYWKKWSSMNIDKCMLNKNKAKGNPKAIKLIELSSAFFVLGVGFTLSTFVFVSEKFFYTCRHIFF